jgi:NAD(P)-dependent dehydrogenase (short-subunit alcohol dehydrogenase family)
LSCKKEKQRFVSWMVTEEELQRGIELIEKLEGIEDIWKESKENPLLSEFLKRCHAVLRPTKAPKEKKEKKQVLKVPKDQRSKFLKSIGGSSLIELEDVPKVGECMDSIDPHCGNSLEIVEKKEDHRPVDEHLKGLKTSTAITEYKVDAYSAKAIRHCVICGNGYSEPHELYHQFCLPCAEFNYSKRIQTIWIPDRIALVTGARVKIGYEIALKLLRSGCHVVGTTRFPKDALRRFALEPDFAEFKDKLSIYSIDFRDLNAVSHFIEHLKSTIGHLDILVNNAAQTVRKPPEFYQHLMKGERVETDATLQNQKLLQSFSVVSPLLLGTKEDQITTQSVPASVLMSQARLLPEEEVSQKEFFPEGQYDYFGQQLDLRPQNSWVLKAADVSPVEMLECQLINSVVPFMFVSKLRPLMEASPHPDRYILNVSAMEGTFYRYKTANHPHTNMAKASLNMLTRTSASDYLTSGIYMTSIDTGWVTDERPHGFLAKKDHNDAPPPPLDELDGAMRVLDPCFMGIRDKVYHYGVLFKDYTVSRW